MRFIIFFLLTDIILYCQFSTKININWRSFLASIIYPCRIKVGSDVKYVKNWMRALRVAVLSTALPDNLFKILRQTFD